jgi:hypothetical protein
LADGTLQQDLTTGSTKVATPYFSVCLPTYNRGYCLATAIQSVLQQDFQDFELLVCDNASTDNTRDVVESFDDPRIRAIYFPELVSMYGNHNRCLEHALADWIVFLHSDDVLLLDALSRFHVLIERYSPDVVYPPLPIKLNREVLIRDAPHLDFFFNHGISPSGTAYKKSAVFATSFFAEHDLIADHSLSIVWATQGRRTVNSQQQFASRDDSENTTCFLMGYGQWNVIVNHCVAPHLAARSTRQLIEAEAANRSPAEVEYAINVMGVCGHPFTILSMCARQRLFRPFCFKAFVKAILIRILGLDGFTRLVYGKRGLQPLE